MGRDAKFQFVISPTGTGKTEAMLRAVRKTSKKVVFINARRSLEAQYVGRAGMRHYRMSPT